MSNNFETDINIAGMINAERKSAPKILLPVKEGLHNSLEIIRLARNKDPIIKGCIYIIFTYVFIHLIILYIYIYLCKLYILIYIVFLYLLIGCIT